MDGLVRASTAPRLDRPADARPTVAIIGAGPPVLTAAYLLTKAGVPVTVLQADPTSGSTFFAYPLKAGDRSSHVTETGGRLVTVAIQA
jgi:protoporphyrinogen oxidase